MALNMVLQWRPLTGLAVPMRCYYGEEGGRRANSRGNSIARDGIAWACMPSGAVG